MRIEKADFSKSKGWYAGPWNSMLKIPIGYASEGINEPHLHTTITEIYMVARGESVVRVERETVQLGAGDVLIIEPGEAHTFLSSSSEYFHFVAHVPTLLGETVQVDKVKVELQRLGL